MDYLIEDVRHDLAGSVRDEIVQFWLEEGALPEERATDRVNQAIQILRSESGGPIIGICTAQIVYAKRVRSYLYNYRSFIGRTHRSHGLVRHLCISSYDLLNGDFVAGKQKLAIGVILDIENAQLQNIAPAVWPTTKFVFIGLKDNGNHVRVRYFDGAQIDMSTAPGKAPAF